MSTDNQPSEACEQQTPQTLAAGCKSEIDRSVLWTDQRSGFAELRRRVEVMKEEAYSQLYSSKEQKRYYSEERWLARENACIEFLRDIDELSGCEECKHVGDRTSTT